jgi:hypothetical protein
MKKILIVLLSLIPLFLCAQNRNGLTISGGNGTFRDWDVTTGYLNTGDKENKLNFELGYKFRFQPNNSASFYDLTLNAGLYTYSYSSTGTYLPLGEAPDFYSFSGNYKNYYFSLNGGYNYTLYGGLFAGAGIEPTIHYRDGAPEKYKFDIPVTAKMGYNFKFVELAFIYKLGFTDVINPGYFSSGKLNTWQVSLFIPF